MPYQKHDQPTPGYPLGRQRHDSYPLADLHFGGIFAANDFDPRMPSSAAHHGYDVNRVVHGYVSASATSDPLGYQQSIYGSGCEPWNGRVYFPVSFLLNLVPGAAGQGIFPVHWDYYEQNGEQYVGVCGSTAQFGKNNVTVWEFDPHHAFGGMNGAPFKYIDTIISTNGFPVKIGPSRSSIVLNRFFLTDLYGMNSLGGLAGRPARKRRQLFRFNSNAVSGGDLLPTGLPRLERGHGLFQAAGAPSVALS